MDSFLLLSSVWGQRTFRTTRSSLLHVVWTVLICKPAYWEWYGIELWGCANKSNIAIMQRYQSKILPTNANAPWYVTNQTLHTDLQIPYVSTVIHDRINKYRIALASHPKPLVEPMLHPEHNRRLQRRWNFHHTDWGGVVGCLPRSPTKLPAH